MNKSNRIRVSNGCVTLFIGKNDWHTLLIMEIDTHMECPPFLSNGVYKCEIPQVKTLDLSIIKMKSVHKQEIYYKIQ